jgi:hypothetical protein
MKFTPGSKLDSWCSFRLPGVSIAHWERANQDPGDVAAASRPIVAWPTPSNRAMLR